MPLRPVDSSRVLNPLGPQEALAGTAKTSVGQSVRIGGRTDIMQAPGTRSTVKLTAMEKQDLDCTFGWIGRCMKYYAELYTNLDPADRRGISEQSFVRGGIALERFRGNPIQSA